MYVFFQLKAKLPMRLYIFFNFFFFMETNAVPKVCLHKLRQRHRDRDFHSAEQWIACSCAVGSMTALQSAPSETWTSGREGLQWKQTPREPG